jgi:AcrR family transcriptional regulator
VEAGSTLRERKKQQTRFDLVRSAVELFVERGFHNTTIDDIADRANYSRRTFFRHFASKEDVAFGDAFDQLMAFQAAMRGHVGAADPIAMVRRELTSVALSFAGEPVDRAAVGLWFQEPALQRRYLEMVHSWESVVREYLLAEYPEAPLQCDVVSTAMCGVIKAVLSRRMEDDAAVLEALALGFGIVDTRALRAPAPPR